MATNPLSQFLTNFAAAHSGVRASQPDPLREAALAQNIHEFRAQAPQREANLALTRAQTEAFEFENQQNRQNEARRLFGEAELRANELGGLRNALDDPVFQQRLIKSVNMIGDTSEMQLAGFERMNRQNAAQWGVPVNTYEQILSERNPQHVPGEDDDEVLVPLYQRPDGSVGPMDTDQDGQIEFFSANEAMDFVRSQFVGSDEIAGALGGLQTGQPGGTARSQTGTGPVGGAISPDAPESLVPPPELDPLFQQASERHGVPVNVIRAIAHQESTYGQNRFNPESGASGLMQYIPETAQSLGIDPNDDQQAVDAAAMQIRQRLDAGDSLEEAVAHHFAGPDRSGWGPLTQEYVQDVMGKIQTLEGSGAVATPQGGQGQRQQGRQRVSADAMTSAGQVATPPAQPAQGGGGGTGTVEFEPLGADARQDLPPSLQTTEDLEESQSRINRRIRERFGGVAANATEGLPVDPAESDETALGIPREQLPEDMSRGARRVTEGKGISPAQAKELALRPGELPQPTPRSTIAAGASFLDGLDPQGTEYTVSGGRRPTHKQLTTAVILNRAGILDTDALTRYADLGVVSSDGVSVIQTGMSQAAASQRQNMIDRRSVIQTGMQQQGQMQRTRIQQQGQDRRLQMRFNEAERIRQAEQQNPTQGEMFERNLQAEQVRLEAEGMPQEEAEQRARTTAAKVTDLANWSRGLRGSDWQSGRIANSVAELEGFDRQWNDRGLRARLGRAVGGQLQTINMSENPLAIMLHAEGSELMETRDPGFWETVARTDPGVDAVVSAFEDPPAFIDAIQEPMVAMSRELGMEGVIQRNPDLQRRIYDAAAVGIRSEMAESGDRSVLNDRVAIQNAILRATRRYLESYQQAGQ